MFIARLPQSWTRPWPHGQTRVAVGRPEGASPFRRGGRTCLSAATILLALVVLCTTGSADTSSSHGGNNGEGSTPFTGLANAPSANLFNGTMSTSIDVLIPPGRALATPEVSLQYSSEGGPSTLGYGWEFPLGSVERSTKEGVPRCLGDETSNAFILRLGGASTDLVYVGDSSFHARIDEAFIEATADVSGNQWTVHDRRGIRYTFGSTTESRSYRAADVFMDTSSCAFTARWALTEVRDPHGNTISITYTTDGNVSYPSTISYGGNDSTALEHPFRISLTYVDHSTPPRSYRLGVDQTLAKLTDQIIVEAKEAVGEPFTIVRTYGLEHTFVAGSGQALLTGVAATGLPDQTFEYQEPIHSVGGAITGSWDFEGLRDKGVKGNVKQTIMDMNGDGFVDVVDATGSWWVTLGTPNGIGTGDTLFWRRNGAPTGDLRKTADLSGDRIGVKADLLDLTGDGLPDFVDAFDGTSMQWTVYEGYCDSASDCGFRPGVAWPAPADHLAIEYSPELEIPAHHYHSYGLSGLQDLNGDGRPDYVVTNQPEGGDLSTMGTWDVYWNEGDAFSSAPDPGFAGRGPLSVSRVTSVCNVMWDPDCSDPLPNDADLVLTHADMNGDSLPDRIFTARFLDWATDDEFQIAIVDSEGNVLQILGMSEIPWCPEPWNVCPGFLPPGGGIRGSFVAVELNTGNGFAPPVFSVVPDGTLSSLRRSGYGYDFVNNKAGFGANQDLLDVNLDGLPDLVHNSGCPTGGNWEALLNLGDGRVQHREPQYPDCPSATGFTLFFSKLRDDDSYGHWTGGAAGGNVIDGLRTGTDIVDWDGDGVPDYVIIDPDTKEWEVRTFSTEILSTDPVVPPLKMTRVDNGVGGITQARYVSSTVFDNGGDDGSPDLPFPKWVVQAIRRTDGLCDASGASDPFDPAENACIGSGHEIVTQYEYGDGLFDPEEREFRGFGMVKTIDGDGNHTVTRFSQDDFTRGKVIERSVYANGIPDPVERETYVWETQSSLSRTQVFMAEKRTERLAVHPRDPSLDQCSLERNEPPDEWGRVQTRCSLPCAGAPGGPGYCGSPYFFDSIAGQVHTIIDWADPQPGSGSYVREKPAHITVGYKPAGESWERLNEKWFYYDDPVGVGLPLGEVVTGDVRRFVTAGGGGHGPVFSETVSYTAHDVYGNVLAALDPRGGASISVYDSSLFSLFPIEERRPVTGGIEHNTSIETDLRYGKPVKVIDENGQITEYAYDTLGRTICEALPGDSIAGCGQGPPFTRTVEYSYEYGNPGAASPLDRHSKVVQLRNEVNHLSGFSTTESFVDALGRRRLERVEQVVGGLLTTVIRAQREYDSVGRVTAAYPPYAGAFASTPSVSAATYDYHLNGHPTARDPLGRAHRVSPPDGATMDTFYEGLQTRTVNARGGETSVIEDHMGNVVGKDSYAGGVLELRIRHVVDGLGRVVDIYQNDDFQTRVHRVYNKLGGLIYLIDPDSGAWRFGYDPTGNLVYQDDPHPDQHVQWCHDALNRVERRCLYDTSDDYVADACSTACAGAISESVYEYDDDLGGTSFGRGRVSRVTDLSGSTTFTYDHRGRTSSVAQSVSGVEAVYAWTYDTSGHVDQMTYPDGEIVEHGYDATGMPTSLGSELGGQQTAYVSNVIYDAFGRATSVVRGNGVKDVIGFHDGSENYRLEGIETRTVSGSTRFLDLAYSYNDLGRIDRIEDLRDPIGDLSNGFEYSYDDLGRLTSADWTAGSTHDDGFDYDPYGNLALKGGAVLIYADPTHPHQLSTHGDTQVQYDANGRQSSKTKPGDSTTYSYDVLGRLTGVDGTGGTSYTTAYAYDFSGQRALKVLDGDARRYFGKLSDYRDGELTKYYFLGGNLVASRINEAPSLESLLRGVGLRPPPDWRIPPEIVGGAGLLVVLLLAWPIAAPVAGATHRARALGACLLILSASVPSILLVPGRALAGGGGGGIGGVVRHLHTNHLGSVEAVTSVNGVLVRQIRYEPFGGVRGRFGPDGVPVAADEIGRIEFGGYESQHESGLQYAGARFYDPELARFLTQDPEGQLASPYAYASDPVNLIDPDGRSFLAALGAFLGFILSASAIIGLVVAITSAVVVGIQSGDLSAALGVFAFGAVLSFASASALTVLHTSISGISTFAGQSFRLAVDLARTGLAASGVARAARSGNALGAIASGIAVLHGAFGVLRTASNVTSSNAVSGLTGEGEVDGSPQGGGRLGNIRVVDYDSPDIFAPDADRIRTGSDQIEAATLFEKEVMEQSLYRRTAGEYVTVARPSEGGWTYDRPRWFRGKLFAMKGISAVSPGFTMHSHAPSGVVGPSTADLNGSRMLGTMGVVVHTGGEGSVWFYQLTRGGDRLAPVRVD